MHNTDNTAKDINNALNLINSNPIPYQVNDHVIGHLMSLRPKGITFSNIFYEQYDESKYRINIGGFASDRMTLRDFKSVLDSNTDYAKVELPISDYIEKKNINFNISITLK